MLKKFELYLQQIDARARELDFYAKFPDDSAIKINCTVLKKTARY